MAFEAATKRDPQLDECLLFIGQIEEIFCRSDLPACSFEPFAFIGIHSSSLVKWHHNPEDAAYSC